jgi:cyclin B
MEVEILGALDYSITFPSAWSFLQRYTKIAEMDEMECCLSQYILELAMVEYDLLQYSPSLQAASAVYVASKVIQRDRLWTSRLVTHTHYDENDLRN